MLLDSEIFIMLCYLPQSYLGISSSNVSNKTNLSAETTLTLLSIVWKIQLFLIVSLIIKNCNGKWLDLLYLILMVRFCMPKGHSNSKREMYTSGSSRAQLENEIMVKKMLETH